MRLGDDRFEGIDEDGQTKFFHELIRGLFDPNKVPEHDLRRYDLNIVAALEGHHRTAQQAGGPRPQHEVFPVSLAALHGDLSGLVFQQPSAVAGWPERGTENLQQPRLRIHSSDFDADELNKVAFWNATGSGKTLLLHVNIRQYLHYFQAGRRDPIPTRSSCSRPMKGLSRQHLEELNLSGFGFSQLFDKNRSGVFKGTIEIIDINKLGDEMGEKTVAVEAFEGNNLVLVDEGHRGTGTAAGAWMSRRETLVRGGFAFEYSATFGQAVAKGLTVAGGNSRSSRRSAKVLFNTTRIKKLDDAPKLNCVDQRRQAACSQSWQPVRFTPSASCSTTRTSSSTRTATARNR
jgi:hypothetical protein